MGQACGSNFCSGWDDAQLFGGEEEEGFDCPCPGTVGAIAALLCKTHRHFGGAGVVACGDHNPSPGAITAQRHASSHEGGYFLYVYVSAVLYIPTEGVSTENL